MFERTSSTSKRGSSCQKIILTLLGVLLSASCTAMKVQEARRAYDDGRLVEAGRIIDRLEVEPDEPESTRLSADIERARRHAARVLLQQAEAIATTEPSTALRRAELALQLAPHDAPERADARNATLALRRQDAVRLKRLGAMMARIGGEPGGCEPDAQIAAYEAAAKAVGTSPMLADRALQAATACFAAGEMEAVSRLTLAAQALTPAGGHLPDDALMRWALTKPQEPDSESDEVASKNGESEKRTSSRRTNGTPSHTAEEKTEASTPQPSAVVLEAHSIIRSARRLLAKDDVFAALTSLDAALASCADEEARKLLVSQSELWRAERKKLVNSLIALGEQAVAEEKPGDAKEWYERVLKLSPGHPVALDRLRKLETLEKLRQQ